MTILDVPYVSQLEDGARKHANDCGAASGVMLIRAYKGDQKFTVDEYYKETGQRGDKYLNVFQIQAVLQNHGVNTTRKTGLSKDDLSDFIKERRPPIVLFNYKIFRNLLSQQGINTQVPFKGYHFAVLVGIDDSFVYLNDPLWSGDNGKNFKVPIDIWMKSWGNFLKKGVQENKPYQAIIPNEALDPMLVETAKNGEKPEVTPAGNGAPELKNASLEEIRAEVAELKAIVMELQKKLASGDFDLNKKMNGDQISEGSTQTPTDTQTPPDDQEASYYVKVVQKGKGKRVFLSYERFNNGTRPLFEFYPKDGAKVKDRIFVEPGTKLKVLADGKVVGDGDNVGLKLDMSQRIPRMSGSAKIPRGVQLYVMERFVEQ